jgi:hypothetical protein
VNFASAVGFHLDPVRRGLLYTQKEKSAGSADWSRKHLLPKSDLSRKNSRLIPRHSLCHGPPAAKLTLPSFSTFVFFPPLSPSLGLGRNNKKEGIGTVMWHDQPYCCWAVLSCSHTDIYPELLGEITPSQGQSNAPLRPIRFISGWFKREGIRATVCSITSVQLQVDETRTYSYTDRKDKQEPWFLLYYSSAYFWLSFIL